MRSMVRARAYPTHALGAVDWLKNAIKHLEWEFRVCNPIKCVAVAEAISLIELRIAAIKIETNKETGRKVFWI